MTLKQFFSLTILATLLLTACNLNPSEAPPAPAPQVVEPVDTAVEMAQVTAIQDSPIWAGPGEQYGQIGGLGIGQMAEIIGRSEQGTHWVIRFAASSNGQGWVTNAMVTVQGDTADVPLVMTPNMPQVAEVPAAEGDESTSEESEADTESDVSEEAAVEPDAEADTDNEEDTEEGISPEAGNEADEVAPVEPEVDPTPIVPTVDEVAPVEPEVDPTPIVPTVDEVAPVEPEVDPTPVVPTVDEIKVDPEPTPVPPTDGLDKVAPQPTPTPGLGIVAVVPLFYNQDSYAGDCGNRPEGTICLGFADGYTWLIEDGLLGWSEGEHEGQQVVIAEGGKGYYHHVLNTNLVKFVPKG